MALLRIINSRQSILILKVQEVYFLSIQHEFVLPFSHYLQVFALPGSVNVLDELVSSGPSAYVSRCPSTALLDRTYLFEIKV